MGEQNCRVRSFAFAFRSQRLVVPHQSADKRFSHKQEKQGAHIFLLRLRPAENSLWCSDQSAHSGCQPRAGLWAVEKRARVLPAEDSRLARWMGQNARSERTPHSLGRARFPKIVSLKSLKSGLVGSALLALASLRAANRRSAASRRSCRAGSACSVRLELA